VGVIIPRGGGGGEEFCRVSGGGVRKMDGLVEKINRWSKETRKRPELHGDS